MRDSAKEKALCKAKIGILIGFVLALFALYELATDINSVWAALKTKSWTPTIAVLKTFEPHTQHGNTTTRWYEIAYEYQVDGEVYIGERVYAYDPGGTKKLDVIGVEEREEFTVYVNPAAPEDVVVARGLPSWGDVVRGFSVVAVILGVGTFLIVIGVRAAFFQEGVLWKLLKKSEKVT